MRLILSKQSQRHLQILEYLYYNDYSTFENLAKITNVSLQTIHKDLNKINDFIAPLHIESYSQYECRLIHQYEISVDYIYSCILRNSIEFRFLEKVFFERHDRLEDYADSLFVSLSTLKRILTKVNKQTKKYGFYIATNPIRITGDEGLIRNMFVNYFREKYLERNYNFSNIQKKVFEQMLMSYVELRKSFMNYPDIETIRVTLFVSLTRLQNGHKYDAKLIDDVKYRYNYPMLRNPIFQQAVKSVFQIELNRENVVDLAYPVVSENLALDQRELLEFCEKSPELKEEHEQMKLLVANISKAVNHNLTVKRNEDLVLELMNSRLSTIGETYLLYNFKHNFLLNLKKDFPLVYQFLYQHIINNNYFNQYEEHEIDVLIYVLLTHWDSLLYSIQFSYPKFKVGIFMNSDDEHTRFLSEILNRKHYSRFTFEPISFFTHQEALDQFDNYDLILTNVSQPKNTKYRIVSVDLYPSRKDFFKLYQMYYELCDDYFKKNTQKKDSV
ncbi:helix-turn-helix domain-containing protein [Vagococcus fluvialis]|uniref:helix-turn-helix domain-containing protein n=1 Tax=Vagococcus fluvialis TaxID=2738 RepID=UPI003B21F3F8